jgi:serine/threonine-protein kinase
MTQQGGNGYEEGPGMERWQQIESLFEEALRRPADERDGWLRDACAGDAELHREVVSLLANYHESGGAGPWAAAAAQLIVKPALLEPGEYLGPYQIVSFVAAGGMGEVYRARDTRLKRDVALKVLPEAFARDPGRMMRFQREAEVLASLNHPNIAQIYGVEDRALVMELVEGESPKGPLPFDDAWKIASQIAAGLEYAHEKGIVHRDLKPANVKVTPDGVVKLLDFGLAKAFTVQTSASGNPENSPTLTLGATQLGVILGTAAYMAPEQAKGKSVDKRADIWSFGVVLYELVTGERLFTGDDVSETLAQVLTKQPNLDKVPFQARRLFYKCLQKDPIDRLRDIGDARSLLEEPQSGVSNPVQAKSLPHVWIAATAMLVLAAAGLALGWYWASRPVDHPLMRFNDDLGVELDLRNGVGPTIAISPDGSRLAYVSDIDGKRQLSVRLIGSAKSNMLANTENAAAPFFSPDGRSIGFFAAGKLKKISVEGGSPVNLCDVGNLRGGYWGEDGNILFARRNGPLMRIPASGGTPAPATTLDQQQKEVTNRSAQLLPGGEAFVFTANKDNINYDDATIQVQNIKSGKRKTLVQHGYFGRYVTAASGAGYLLYVESGTIFAAPMNLKRLELTGPAVPVVDDAARASNGFAEFDVTPSGTLVYVSGSSQAGQQSLAWFNRDGTRETLPAAPAGYGHLQVSPDGTRIAMTVQQGSEVNLTVYEWAANRMTRLTTLKALGPFSSAWAPDGKHIAFAVASNDLSGPGIYWIRADGAGEPQRLLEQGLAIPSSFSPDGKRVAYTSETLREILTLPVDLADPEHPKPGKPESFLKENTNLRDSVFSPDGRWIAYVTVEGGSGRPDVFVRPFPANAAGGRWKISTVAGAKPIWSRASHELIFDSPEGTMAVSYTVKGDSFVPSQPQPWPDKAHQMPSYNRSDADLTPDGKRMLMAVQGDDTVERPTHVTFLLNFADDLAKRAEVSR